MKKLAKSTTTTADRPITECPKHDDAIRAKMLAVRYLDMAYSVTIVDFIIAGFAETSDVEIRIC